MVVWEGDRGGQTLDGGVCLGRGTPSKGGHQRGGAASPGEMPGARRHEARCRRGGVAAWGSSQAAASGSGWRAATRSRSGRQATVPGRNGRQAAAPGKDVGDGGSSTRVGKKAKKFFA